MRSVIGCCDELSYNKDFQFYRPFELSNLDYSHVNDFILVFLTLPSCSVLAYLEVLSAFHIQSHRHFIVPSRALHCPYNLA